MRKVERTPPAVAWLLTLAFGCGEGTPGHELGVGGRGGSAGQNASASGGKAAAAGASGGVGAGGRSGGGGVSGDSGTGGTSGVGGGSGGPTVGGQAGAGGAAGSGVSGAGGAGNTGGMAGRSAAGATASGGNGGAGPSGGTSGGKMGSAGGANVDCMTPPPASPLTGWASEEGGTTGGRDATPIVVDTAQALTDSLSGSTARVIHVVGTLTGSFNVGSNKSVIGVCGAEIHGHIGIGGESNIVLRNLKIVGNDCADSPSDCSAGADAIGVNAGSHHLFFDHLDVSDGSDGNLDITQGSDFVTIAWSRFSYSHPRSDPDAGASGHRFSNLIGASDTDDRDPGHLNVTFHHCWWAENVDQRMPRTRRGQIHVYNNLFTARGNDYCTNAGQDAKLLVQNNVYDGVNNPLQVSANGNLKSEGNDFIAVTGNQAATGAGFTPPYDFTLDSTASLAAAIQAGVGPK